MLNIEFAGVLVHTRKKLRRLFFLTKISPRSM